MDESRRKLIVLGATGLGAGGYAMLDRYLETGLPAGHPPRGALAEGQEELMFAAQTMAEEALSRQYTADRFQGSITDALNSSPLGANVDFAAGGAFDPLVVTGERNLYGRGIYAPVTLTEGPADRDLLTVRPPADGEQRAGMTLRDTLYIAETGRDAIRIDLSGRGRRMTRLLLDNVHAIAGAGYALNIDNELSERDAISTSYVRGGSYRGGIRIEGGGDSLKIDAAQVSGRHGIHVALNHQGAGGGGADASQLVLTGINCTGATGISILSGTRTRIEYCNLELPEGGSGSGGALVHLRGPGTPGGTIENATVFGNYLAPIQRGKSALRLSQTNGAQVVNNTITCGMEGYGVVIDAESRNTLIGLNTWEVPPGHEVLDQGRGTMGVLKGLQLLGDHSPLQARAAPQFVKRPVATGGMVELMGSLTGGQVTAEDVLFVLPEGFRPVSYELLPMRLITDGSNSVVDVIIAPTGEAMFEQGIRGAALLELRLRGTFFSPLI